MKADTVSPAIRTELVHDEHRREDAARQVHDVAPAVDEQRAPRDGGAVAPPVAVDPDFLRDCN